jgi:hypothetical protein
LDARGVMPVSGAIAPAPAVEQKHSALGIVSLVLALCGALGLFAALAVAMVAGALETTGKSLIPDDSPAEAALGLALFAAMGLEVLALGVSFGGLFDKDRKRVLAIVAMAISVMSLGASGLLLLVGALAD